jgi:ATP-dependent Clp protease ATP-binding subunit ClpA
MQNKKALQVDEVPFFSSVLTYAYNHGNEYITPAHFISALLNDFEVRNLFMKTFHIDNHALYEIARGLFEYCENMRMDYVSKENPLQGFSLSMEMYDFMDNYNRELAKSTNMTATALFTALSKSSTEIASIFEVVMDKSFDYILKTFSTAEGKNNTFGLTVQEYFEYVNWMKSMNPVDFKKVCASVLDNKDADNEELTAARITAIKRFAINCDLTAFLSNETIATSFYDSLKASIESHSPLIFMANSSAVSFCFGYEELYTLLDHTAHLNELDSIVDGIASIYDDTSTEAVEAAREAAKEAVKGVINDQSSPDVEEAKVDKEVYMYGNEKILDVTKDILVRVDNPYLIVLGDSGTGKTTFVDKIISMATNNEFSDIGLDLYPCTLDIQALNSKSKFRGQFEDNYKRFISEMVSKAEKANKKPLLIMEDINQTVPIGQTSGDVTDLYIMVMKSMEKYHFPIIGTCTYDEYRQTVAKKRRYNDKFTIVRLEEPAREGVLTIMKEKAKELEESYNQTILDSTYTRVYDLANQFIRDKRYPAKALTLLNQTCAYAYTHNVKEVTPDCVEAVMERDYSVPSARLNTNLAESIRNIATDVKSHVFGQDEAVDIMVKYWKIKQAGLTKENKPIASLLFVGPTGVGKTELAKQFAKSIGYKLIRFDMSEYKEGHTISKLIGSPAGYVAHEEGGLLVNAIKSNPNCVLLLDEIEKAHSNIYDILLQIMDNAELTGNSGEKVDFQNVVLIMTSNCGARDAEGARSLGFINSEDSNNKLKSEIMNAELSRVFTPEFRGRLSAIVNFNSLSEKMCIQITDLRLKELEESLKKTRENITLSFTDTLKTHIVNKTLSEKSGGRSIEKFIDEKIKDTLLDTILELNTTDKVDINLDFVDNNIVAKVN